MSLAEQMPTGYVHKEITRLVDGLVISEKLVPILFGIEPERIAGRPGPHKAIRFGRTSTSRPILEGFRSVKDATGEIPLTCRENLQLLS